MEPCKVTRKKHITAEQRVRLENKLAEDAKDGQLNRYWNPWNVSRVLKKQYSLDISVRDLQAILFEQYGCNDKTPGKRQMLAIGGASVDVSKSTIEGLIAARQNNASNATNNTAPNTPASASSPSSNSQPVSYTPTKSDSKAIHDLSNWASRNGYTLVQDVTFNDPPTKAKRFWITNRNRTVVFVAGGNYLDAQYDMGLYSPQKNGKLRLRVDVSTHQSNDFSAAQKWLAGGKKIKPSSTAPSSSQSGSQDIQTLKTWAASNNINLGKPEIDKSNGASVYTIVNGDRLLKIAVNGPGSQSGACMLSTYQKNQKDQFEQKNVGFFNNSKKTYGEYQLSDTNTLNKVANWLNTGTSTNAPSGNSSNASGLGVIGNPPIQGSAITSPPIIPENHSHQKAELTIADLPPIQKPSFLPEKQRQDAFPQPKLELPAPTLKNLKTFQPLMTPKLHQNKTNGLGIEMVSTTTPSSAMPSDSTVNTRIPTPTVPLSQNTTAANPDVTALQQWATGQGITEKLAPSVNPTQGEKILTLKQDERVMAIRTGGTGLAAGQYEIKTYTQKDNQVTPIGIHIVSGTDALTPYSQWVKTGAPINNKPVSTASPLPANTSSTSGSQPAPVNTHVQPTAKDSSAVVIDPTKTLPQDRSADTQALQNWATQNGFTIPKPASLSSNPDVTVYTFQKGNRFLQIKMGGTIPPGNCRVTQLVKENNTFNIDKQPVVYDISNLGRAAYWLKEGAVTPQPPASGKLLNNTPAQSSPGGASNTGEDKDTCYLPTTFSPTDTLPAAYRRPEKTFSPALAEEEIGDDVWVHGPEVDPNPQETKNRVANMLESPTILGHLIDFINPEVNGSRQPAGKVSAREINQNTVYNLTVFLNKKVGIDLTKPLNSKEPYKYPEPRYPEKVVLELLNQLNYDTRDNGKGIGRVSDLEIYRAVERYIDKHPNQFGYINSNSVYNQLFSDGQIQQALSAKAGSGGSINKTDFTHIVEERVKSTLFLSNGWVPISWDYVNAHLDEYYDKIRNLSRERSSAGSEIDYLDLGALKKAFQKKQK